VRGTFACVLAEQACTEDTDCSTGLSCQQAPSARSCGSSGPAGVDGGLVAEAECAGATKQCAPPGYFPTSSTGSRDATLAGTGEAVDSSEHKGDAGTSNGVTAPPQANGQTPVVADGSATPAEVEDGCAVAVSRSDGGLWFGMLSLALFYQRRRARPPA
jgi:MYXO-CTERM domain-containing protein